MDLFFNKFNAVDTELFQVSQLLFLDETAPVPHGELIDAKLMDYSLNSLGTIEKYLNQLPKDILNEQYNLIVLRVGAYVGEVIKQQKNSDFHWYDYKTAIKLNREIEQWGKRIDTAAVLHSRKKNQMIFPLAKVCKFIQNGSEDSLMFFATAMIEGSQA